MGYSGLMQKDWFLNSPEVRFWKRFFKMAVDDLYSLKRTYRRTAKAWFKNNDDGIGSFRWVCELFNLDPISVRKKLLTQHHPPASLTSPGLALRLYRQRNDISQTTLAKTLGCSSSYLSKIETGQKQFNHLPKDMQDQIISFVSENR